MKNIKNKAVTTLLANLLIVSITLVVLSNSTETTVKAQTTIPTNMLQYEWIREEGGPEGTAFSNGPAPNAPNIKWKTEITGVSGFPVAFNGMVFVQALGSVYALDGGTGDIIWTVPLSGEINKIDETFMLIGSTCVLISDGTTAWVGPPQLTGMMYLADLKMIIDWNYGWNLPDPSQPPTLAWNRTLEYDVGHGFLLAYGDGKIFIGTEDGLMNCIDATSGEIIWQSPTTSTAQNYPGVYIDGKIIHGGLDNNMHCWDAETGERLWTYNPGTFYGQWASDAGAAYGMVYEHNQDNYVYAINATTGEMVWRSIGPGIGYSGCLVIGDGKVYSPMGEAQYRDFATGEYAYAEYSCFDAFTGELIWTLPMETGAAYQPHECIAYGNLYVIPITGTATEPGVWTYGTTGASLNEVWCISDEVPDWSMFMSDPEHSAEGAGPTNLALKWKFETDSQIVCQPTLVDGVCYFGSLDHKIYAVDAETGTEIWTYETDYQVKSSVAVVNGKLFTGADDGNIYCLDAASGTKIWETFAGGVTKNLLGSGTYLNIIPPVRSSPMVVGNNLFVGALDGNLYKLDTNTGNVLWKFETEGPILATPTIVDGKIYFPSCTGGYPLYLTAPSPQGDFYCLNADSGSVIWQKQIPYVLNRTFLHGNHLQASPTVAEGMVFVRNGFLYTYALDANTGETIWTNTQRFNPGTGSQTGGVTQCNAPLYAYGRIYMNDYYGVVCINATDGSEIWFSWLSRENLAPSLAYAYGRVYTVNEVGVLYVLDALTGEKLSYYQFGTYQMHGSPTPYNGNLYLGLNDWNMYCLGEARLMDSAPEASVSASTLMSEPVQAITESPLISTEVSIITVVAVACTIGAAAYLALRKRK